MCVALCWAEGDTASDVSRACVDLTDDWLRPELFSMKIHTVWVQISYMLYNRRKIHLNDDDDAEMRNVKLSIITVAMIFLMFGAVLNEQAVLL